MSCFFEPNYETGRPVRWRIERQDGEPFTIAAIWDRWKPQGEADEVLHSFSLLTVNSDEHPLMRRFHRPGHEKRSLVVVPAERREEWLQTDDPSEFMTNFPPEEFLGRPDPLPPQEPKKQIQAPTTGELF
jgi:putative SOS response-associated peptidase YedK